MCQQLKRNFVVWFDEYAQTVKRIKAKVQFCHV